MPECPLTATGGDVFALSWGFGNQRVLASAARTGILRKLDGSPTTVEDAASALDLDEGATGKIVRALHAMGLLEAVGERYRLVSGLLGAFSGGDRDFTPFVAHSDGLNDFWGESLEGWIRTGEHPRRMRSAEAQQQFGAAMKAIASHLAPHVIEELDLSSARRTLDLGGGVGFYATLFCRANPDLRATVLEHPEVAQLGRAEVAGTELEDRITFLGGNYLADDLGKDWDVVLLANVLHQELPDDASALVSRAAAALAPGGQLAVVDFAIDDEKRQNLVGALFAINMRSFGDTYSESEIRGWMKDAGLELLPTKSLAPAHWLITGRRP